MRIRRRLTRRNHTARRWLNIVAAVVVSAVLLGVLGFGYGTIPALGPALDPGRGVWTADSSGEPVHSQTLTIPGLQHPVTVTFTKQYGIASIDASTDHDLFEALGYVHARFRLTEMDEERRLGEGRLAQLAGPSDLSSDEFELRLGLLRTAQTEWAQMPKDSEQAQGLIAYAQGVNDDIAQVRASGQWPATFTLAGVYPGEWTPVDSLVIQGELVQELDFTTTPLDYALLERSLGAQRTMDLFPVIAKNAQTPYDPGPYKYDGLTSLAPDAASSAPLTDLTARTASTVYSTTPSATAAGTLLAEIGKLPAGQVHEYPDSNAWAASDGTTAQLAGDPHLPQTLPSVWYEVALAAPGYNVAGVSVPGLPGILIGHNQNIAWSLTDAQDQSTEFYTERTRGDEYYWDGAWRPMTVEHYDIPVRGEAAVRLTVDITVHGPIMTQAGQSTSVDWMGNVPSDDLEAMLGVSQATDFQQFKTALSHWYAPTQNFVYADDKGNVGAISAGYWPEVSSQCQPWLPMPGTGGCDVTGVIPYAAVPQVYDPPSHVVATANQRQVTAAYPYYIGTSADFFDAGYRAATIYQALDSGNRDFPSIQNSVKDQLAARIVPRLLAALPDSPERDLLSNWNADMSENSGAAAIWWTFWSDYLYDVFHPWWQAKGVPVGKDVEGLGINAATQPSLDEDLEAWTLGDQSNAAFDLPSGQQRTATGVMREAFNQAVAHLTSVLGANPDSWTWGALHTREFRALSGADGLGYGPRASGGDAFTPDAADGDLSSSSGPSWRMDVTLSASGVSAIGVYPGGQDENPTSPWYDNQVSLWWDGKYLPVPEPASTAGPVAWWLRG
jgi:penicillin amidase